MIRSVSRLAILAAAVFVCAPVRADRPVSCKPKVGAASLDVLVGCGQPQKRYKMRWRVADVTQAEWDYGQTIVGLIDDRVAYVLDLTK